MRRYLGVIAFVLCLVGWFAWVVNGQVASMVSGRVVDALGEPVPHARVRQKTTDNLFLADEQGSFALPGLAEGITVTVTAWQEGYLVGWADILPPREDVLITLTQHYTTDNPAYSWFSSHDPANEISCMHCMVAYPEWKENAHANAGTNPRFFSMYNGTDLLDEQQVAPGFKMDFPGTAGNCATCHAPAAAVSATEYFMTADMNALRGVEAEGVFCEFCHKVGDVYLNPRTGLPYDNVPGVLSMRLYRPEEGGAEQLFFGPFDDVTRRVAYSELQTQSQFCAPCHQFSYWGTPIYQSFSEWQASAYAEQGVQCQDCHMRPTGIDYFVYPEKGGLIRDPASIASHLQPGAADHVLLQNTVALTVTASLDAGQIMVDVALRNALAGHDVPTDYPGRQMLLVVEALDEQGTALPLIQGGTLPEWAGLGQGADDYGGQPGKAYAKVLQDAVTGQWPVVNYWKQVLIREDTRLAALATDESQYRFQAPASGPVQVQARVLFRRLFQDLMEAKGWDTPDIRMAQVAVEVVDGPVIAAYQPNMDKVYDPPKPAARSMIPTSAPQRDDPSESQASGAASRGGTAMALTPDGMTLLVANPDSDSVTVLDVETLAVLAEIGVGWRPRTVAIDGLGQWAVVANQDSGDISILHVPSQQSVGRVAVGHQPAGVVITADGRWACVTLRGQDQVALVDVQAEQVVARVSVPPKPEGIALLADERTLLVTHLLSGQVSVIAREPWHGVWLPLLLRNGGAEAASTGRVTSPDWRLTLERTVSTWPDSNLSQRIVVNADESKAYLPQTRSNEANQALTFDTTVFPIVAVLDLETWQLDRRANLALDVIDEPVGIPTDGALSAQDSLLWVVNAASNDISVVDVVGKAGVAHIEVGAQPQGIVIAADGERAFVSNALDGTVSVIDVRRFAVVDVVPVTELPLPPVLLRGKQLFHSSDSREDERLAKEQWMSCNTCHFEGEQDGIVWQFGFAGPRNTTSLLGMVETYPLRWSAEWDESADSEFAVRKEQMGTGLIEGEMHDPLGAYNQGRSYDLDSLALYMDSLALGPSPHKADGEAIARGQAIFERPDTQCSVCHPAPLYTDLQTHDVGTVTSDERIGPAFDTPTIKGVWATAPYLHDGSAATLLDVLTTCNADDRHGATQHLSAQELDDLVAFMMACD